MFSLFLIVVAFVVGLVIGIFHTKFVAWLKRRAEANRLKAAQKLVDDYNAAVALLQKQLPVFPPKPQV